MAIVPSFDEGGGGAAAVDQLRIVIDRAGASGGFTNVVDTTVSITPGAQSIEVDFEVSLLQDPQVFRVTLQASLNGVVYYSGTSQVSITRGQSDETAMVEVPIVYAGPPFQALTITPRDTIVLPGQTFALEAFALDSLGELIPTPFATFRLVNPADSTQLSVTPDGNVTVSANALTTSVIVEAQTPDSLKDQALIQIGDFVARRRWRVDPSSADPYPTQWGTPEYPFSTINRALARAAFRDTVSVAVATYNEVISGDRPVVLLGDSNAAGVPTVMSPGPSGAIVSATGRVDVHRMRFVGATGPLSIRGTPVSMSSLVFTNVSGPALSVTQSGATTIQGITISGVTGGPLGRGIQVSSSAGLNLRNANISVTDAAGVRADSMGFVHVAASDIQQTGMVNDTAFGIEVAFTDSVRIDSMQVHDTNGGGIAVGGATILTARGNTITRTHVNTVEPNGFTDRTAFFTQDVLIGRIVEASVTNNNAAGFFVLFTGVNGSVAIDSSTISGDYWAIRGFTFSGATTIGRVTARGNTITGRLGGPLTRAIGLGPLRTAIIEGNQISSIEGEGIFPAPADTAIVRRNTLTNVRPMDSTSVITGLSTRIATIDSNQVNCAAGSEAFGISYHDGSGTIEANNVAGCRFGGFSSAVSGQFNLFIRSNFFSTGQVPTIPAMGYQVQGRGYHVEMVDNNVSGGTYNPFGALVVLGDAIGMRSVRMTGNVVTSGVGRGLSLENVDTVLVDSNTVSFLDSVPGFVLPAVQTSGIRSMGTFRHNLIDNNSAEGFYFSGVATAVSVDSNTISNNGGPGIWLDDAATLGVDSVSASFNLILSQFTWGALITGMGGSFMNNDFIGNGFAGLDNQNSALVVNATGSYWNDPLGPRCIPPMAGCDAQTTGDFVAGAVVGGVTFIPVSASPNTVLPGPPLARQGEPILPTSPRAMAWITPVRAMVRADGESRITGGGNGGRVTMTPIGFPRQ